ncbi:methyltransferase domain-containing protein [Candidatus Woesearchaeota archaeon]|nr:methyltransferase domain-containing protein [Candidatus Woesearchaeota archaeon]
MLKGYFSYLYKNTEEEYKNSLHSLLEKNRNAKLLDCGCWDGNNTKKFGSFIGTNLLYGIEINKQKAMQALKNSVKVKVSDLNKSFPYQDNFFDVVIANHVIEHLVDVRNFISEIHRVLKKNGYAVIGTPNLASWHNVFALLLGLQPFSGPTIKPDYESDISLVKKINKKRLDKVFYGNKTKDLEHIKVMTTRALTGLLNDFNLKIELIKGFGYYPLLPLMAKPLSGIDPYHSHYIIVKARK